MTARNEFREGELLCDVARTAQTRIRVRLTEFRGHAYLDVREWNLASGCGDDYRPGRGITLNARTVDAVIEALQRGAPMLDTQGGGGAP